MRYVVALITLLLTPVSALAEPYLALSLGTSLERHSFDVWNGADTSGRRALTGRSASSDQALAIGYSNAFQIGQRSFDLEFELFERRNARFTARGTSGAHGTRIVTHSALVSVWTQITARKDWSFHIGAGVGARNSRYQMSGPGVAINSTDHAPYAMVGLRARKQLSDGFAIFADWRIHTRPPVRLSGATTAFAGPLEHNSQGQTLRVGLRLNLRR